MEKNNNKFRGEMGEQEIRRSTLKRQRRRISLAISYYDLSKKPKVSEGNSKINFVK